MEEPIYEGSHRDLFQEFLNLVEDYDAQTAALLDLALWDDVGSILTIGGGTGIVEATLLQSAPSAEVWYLDPSPEQCQAFRQYMEQEQLIERVADVAETTFQDYNTEHTFDRIVSMFSWFFIGTDRRWLTKLLDLLAPGGSALIVLPNSESIEVDFNRSLSPDERTTLDSDDVVKALEMLDCTVSLHEYTKWLANRDLFEGQHASGASLTFAAFAAMRPITTFSAAEKRQVVDLLNARREARGVPLLWDVIVVKQA